MRFATSARSTTTRNLIQSAPPQHLHLYFRLVRAFSPAAIFKIGNAPIADKMTMFLTPHSTANKRRKTCYLQMLAQAIPESQTSSSCSPCSTLSPFKMKNTIASHALWSNESCKNYIICLLATELAHCPQPELGAHRGHRSPLFR